MSEVLTPEAPDKPAVPDLLPLLTLLDTVVFPSMIVPLIVQGEREVKAIENAALGQKVVGLFWQHKPTETFDRQVIGQTGTAAHIVRLMRLADGRMQLMLQGLARIQIQQLQYTDPYPVARVRILPDAAERSTTLEGLARGTLSLFQEVVNLAPYLPGELSNTAASLPEPGLLADFIAAHLNLRLEERQAILDTLDVAARLAKVTELLQREKEILEIGRKAQQEMSKAQREYYLRQQLEAIRRELGETDERQTEVNALRERLEQAQLPEEARKEAERELERLARMPPGAPEYVVARTYLDWILDLPWQASTEDNLDIGHARQVLDEDHYDLDRVKDRILEYLAVRALKPEAEGPLLCFVGPPGIGKTSLGQSIARALGRKFVRLSLGGVRDEAEIRGHRRTYIGALPGRIIQGLRQAGARTPVFMLDEVDKLSVGFQGDPAAALLQVLDPEQNRAFVDHYMAVPFDLSSVMFICTANVTDTIPAALLDRLEVLELPGYTEDEKLQIARKYLVPRQLAESGLTAARLTITDAALRRVIREYTREAGVRNLERWIGAICHKIARQVSEGKPGPFNVDAADLDELLEPPRFRTEALLGEDEVGVATGLAWTPAGGDVLFVEAAIVPGKGGVAPDRAPWRRDAGVRPSSADLCAGPRQPARHRRGLLSQIRRPHPCARWRHPERRPVGRHHHRHGAHLGADAAARLQACGDDRGDHAEWARAADRRRQGESAGGTARVGVHTVILPKENRVDLREVPASAREQLHFVFAEHMDEVLPVALHPVAESALEPAAVPG
jgi:ATP-dependent Lon protease